MRRALFAARLLASLRRRRSPRPAAPAAPAPDAGPTPAAVIAPVPESPGQSMIEQDESAMSGRAYSYDPAGPARPVPLAARARAEPRRRRAAARNRGHRDRRPRRARHLEDARPGYVAQIRATDNKSYLMRAGDLLYDGEVIRVGPNEVTFRQNLNDPQSVKPFREVTKQLNATVKQ